MNEPKYFTYQEGGEWFPWGGGHVDGRSFNKRSKAIVKINGVDVHSMRMDDGREWDCVNGWRNLAAEQVSPETVLIQAEMRQCVEIAALGSSEINPAQVYASRVWAGQSDHVPREERLERVRKALEGQGFSMEGIVL